jgi:hypothetical protein
VTEIRPTEGDQPVTRSLLCLLGLHDWSWRPWEPNPELSALTTCEGGRIRVCNRCGWTHLSIDNMTIR